MSAVIKTTTPFLIEMVLFNALEKMGAEPQRITCELQQGISQRNSVQDGDILINRSDYYGRQLFRQQGERWLLSHDSSEMNGRVVNKLTDRRYTPVSRFLTELSSAYDVAYQQYLELSAENERIRLERERKARVETVRQQAIAKAKAQGYSVKESQTATGQVQLVLTRTV